MVKRLGALGAFGALVLVGAGCTAPAVREVEFAAAEIGKVPELRGSRVDRPDGFRLLASDALTAAVELRDGEIIRFARVGYKSFGGSAVNVVIAEADGLVPRIASCDGVSFPNFHREAALGHHFQPRLIDVVDALKRSGELLEEIQYWPLCPQSWEVQDKFGENYRYCAHRKDTPVEPPRPSECE